MSGSIELKAEILKERLACYARLRGGFPIPIAGIVYWSALAVAGLYLSPGRWAMAAFIGSGLIFPLALLFARIFGNTFMRDTSALNGVIAPAFVGMLLFWPMAIAAHSVDPQLTPLMLAIGLSLHWPVIGWTYARPVIYSAHAIVRALVVTAIWIKLPEARFTLLPASVAVVYLLTVLVIAADSGRVRTVLARAD